MQELKSNLSVSTEVLEKMAELAACEVEGVEGISKKALDFKDAVKTKSPFKGVKIENINGALTINVYIRLKRDANVRKTAQEVQTSVKEKVQTMTGAAVTKVNVTVADISIAQEENKSE